MAAEREEMEAVAAAAAAVEAAVVVAGAVAKVAQEGGRAVDRAATGSMEGAEMVRVAQAQEEAMVAQATEA